ncbi:unnamed protein product [Pieris macdunnoughi]|nr:unnamed protein product [Pieris macdunnoughi]
MSVGLQRRVPALDEAGGPGWKSSEPFPSFAPPAGSPAGPAFAASPAPSTPGPGPGFAGPYAAAGPFGSPSARPGSGGGFPPGQFPGPGFAPPGSPFHPHPPHAMPPHPHMMAPLPPPVDSDDCTRPPRAYLSIRCSRRYRFTQLAMTSRVPRAYYNRPRKPRRGDITRFNVAWPVPT